MHQPEIYFVRNYDKNLQRSKIVGGLADLDDPDGLLDFETLKAKYKDLPSVPVDVEAHWEKNTTKAAEKRFFCGGIYRFYPSIGIVKAQNASIIGNSAISTGVILHSSTTIVNSDISSGCEIGNLSTISNSRIGGMCLIGSHCVLESVQIDTNRIEHMTIITPRLIEVDYSQYHNIRSEGNTMPNDIIT